MQGEKVYIVMVNDGIREVFAEYDDAYNLKSRLNKPDEGIFVRVYEWTVS